MMKLFSEKKFKTWAPIVALILIGLTSFLGYKISDLKFDYDFEKFFPAEDTDADYFYAHRNKFEYDNNFILIAIENKSGIFEVPFMQKISSITEKISSQAPYVTGVRSITNQDEVSLFGINNAVTRPYVDIEKWKEGPEFISKDSTRIYGSKELLNTLVAKDGTSLCIFVKHQDGLSVKKSDTLVKALKSILHEYKVDGIHLAGTTVGQRYYIEKMNSELLFFMALSAILVILFLFIAFRSGWGILVPQVVIFASMLWVIGGMGLFNSPMNILLTTLPSIMFVVAMSDVIHLVSRYMDALRDGYSKFESIKTTLREVGFPTLLTSLTTSVGFFSLYFINVQPVKMFGLIIGIGVLLAFLLSILFLPILFYYFPSPKIIDKRKETMWGKFLPKAYDWITTHQRRIWVGSAVFIGLSLLGMTYLKSDNLLMDDLKATDPIKADFYFFDQHYGGYRPFELAVNIVDTNETAWSIEVLNELEEVEAYLENTMGVELKTSLVQSLKVLSRSSHFGDTSFFKLPKKKREIKRFRRYLKMAERGELLPLFLDSTERLTRIQGTLPDLGNNIITARTDLFQGYLAKRDFQHIKVRVTGSAFLLDKNIRYLSNSLIYGLLLSIGVVSIIMGLVFKSLRMVLISLLPNTIPLVFIAAIMGYLGIEVKTSTSIIFTIAFGIAVDDTIHLLGKFKFELMKGKSVPEALKHSFIVTGKAMVLTTLILCSGFLLLLFSTFMGTFNMGLLLGITLFVALILDLTLLPLLILKFYKEPSQAQDRSALD
jgi:predicted RND superfamily exporter protein